MCFKENFLSGKTKNPKVSVKLAQSVVVGVSMKMIGQNVLNHVYDLNIEHAMIPNLLLVVNVLGKTENFSFVMVEIAKVT